jgi:hypothetical protein
MEVVNRVLRTKLVFCLPFKRHQIKVELFPLLMSDKICYQT